MSDLDKMMDKLKKTKKKKVEETPKEDPVDPDDDEEEVKDDTVDPDDDEDETETPKEEDQEVSVEQEVAILQNDGIFRRELLGALRELINVETINAQALIDLNKKIGGALNDKNK